MLNTLVNVTKDVLDQDSAAPSDAGVLSSSSGAQRTTGEAEEGREELEPAPVSTSGLQRLCGNTKALKTRCTEIVSSTNRVLETVRQILASAAHSEVKLLLALILLLLDTGQ